MIKFVIHFSIGYKKYIFLLKVKKLFIYQMMPAFLKKGSSGFLKKAFLFYRIPNHLITLTSQYLNQHEIKLLYL